MMNRKHYKEFLEMSNTTTLEIKPNLQAIFVLSQLGNPDRQLFSDYYQETGKSSPAPLLGDYLTQQGVSSMGLRMGLQMRELVLGKLRTNNHKSAMLGAVGQAHLDLCMAVTIAEACKADKNRELPYSEYLTIAKNSIELLFEKSSEVRDFYNKFGISLCDPVVKELAESANLTEEQKQIALNRIDTALNIILLWNKSRIEYDDTYVDIQELCKELAQKTIERERTMFYLSRIYCVQQDRNSFTQEEISIATALFAECDSDAVKEFKKNPECSTIQEAKELLAKNQTPEMKEEIRLLTEEANKKEAQKLAKEQNIKEQLQADQDRLNQVEQEYQDVLSNWVKENSAYLAIGYDITHNNNADNLIEEEPFDFLKGLIRDLSREIDLSKLDCPEQIDDKFSSWCISTTMPRRSK